MNYKSVDQSELTTEMAIKVSEVSLPVEVEDVKKIGSAATEVILNNKIIRTKLPAENVTVETLDSLNVAQEMKKNKENLIELGGVLGLADKLGTSIESGLSKEQVFRMRDKYGENIFPESPMEGFFMLFIGN